MKTIKLSLVLLILGSSICTLKSQSKINSDSTSVKEVPFQISFVPYFTTNPVRNSPVNVSINIIGGINQQVNAFEAGGVFNIVDGNSGNCQLAGMMNLTNGQSKGLQAAGVINIANSVKGMQMAGYINIAKSNVEVAQIAGMANIAGGKVTGAQIAGFFSSAPQIDGAQLSGFCNLSQTTVGGQVSGFTNVAKKMDGLQLAGFTNVTTDITGFQISGFANVARDVNGSQVSGFINVAHNITGLQIGVFNFADSCSGLPIGLFSYVRKGYHKFEISGDEFSYAGLSYKTGVRHLYSIINVGYRPFDSEAPFWNHGVGLGTFFGGNNKYQYNLELTCSQVLKGNSYESENTLTRLYVGIDRQLGMGTSIDFGLTYNLLSLDTKDAKYESDFKDMAHYSFTNNTVKDFQLQSWLGARLAFRF